MILLMCPVRHITDVMKYKIVFMIKRVLICAMCVCMCHVPLYAQEYIASEMLAVLTIKILNYDRTLIARKKEDIGICIVYDGVVESERMYADELLQAFQALRVKVSVYGYPVRAEIFDCNENEGVLESRFIDVVTQKNIVAAVVLLHDEEPVSRLSPIVRRLKVNSLCLYKKWVAQYFAFSVAGEPGDINLAVNIDIATQEGSDYSSKLLALCSLLKNP